MAWGFGDRPQLSIKWALALCHWAGFPRENLVDAVAVMTAESARYPDAFHENIGPYGDVVSIDRGLFQINSIHGEDSTFNILDNAKYAHDLFRVHGFTPWAAYNSGAYRKNRLMVRVVLALGTWRKRVPLVDGLEEA